MSLSAAESVWDKINGWMSPLDGLVDGLLRPLVAPLADMFDWVTGDSAQVRSTAQRWRDLATMLDAVVDHHARAIAPVAADWDGAAHDAFAAAMSDLRAQVQEIAEAASQTSDFLDDAAMEIEVAEELVSAIIRELIEWALLTLVVSAALAVVTFGASALAGGAAAAAEAAVATSRIATVLTKIAAALTRLAQLATALRTAKMFSALSVIRTLAVRPLVGGATGLSGNPVVGGVEAIGDGLKTIALDELDDQRSGQTGQQTPVRDHLDDVLGPVARALDPVLDVVDPVLDALEVVDDHLPANPFGG